MAVERSDQELREIMRQIVARVDLEQTGLKKFTKLLGKELGGIDLSHKKDFIKTTLTDIINEESDGEQGSDGGEDDDHESKGKKIIQTKRGGRGSVAAAGSGGGLNAVKEISDELANFLGKGKHMARTEIVKMLWEYIREHDLQNPKNKREIFLDARMKAVFGCDTFNMFTMNKYVGAHVHPYKPVDLTGSASNSPKKRKKKAQEANVAKKKRGGGGGGGGGGGSGGGLQAPYRLSPELAAIVGYDILPRPQVAKKLWVYIKANNLQNENDKREIICDEKLRKIMENRDKVTMFTMNKYVTPHLVEKVDESEYTPPPEGNEDGDEDEDEEEED